MNKWEPINWKGVNYLIVPNTDPNRSGCKQCIFNENVKHTDQCPRYEGPTRKHLYCIVHEDRIAHESYLIHDTPESVAEYIAAHLSS